MTDRINYQASKPSFDMGRVLSRAFAGVFRNIKPILLAIVIVISVSTVLSLPLYLQAMNNSMTESVAATQSPIYQIATFISSVMTVFFVMFFCVFTDHLAFAKFTNRSVGFRYVFLRSIRLTIPVLFIVFLYFISSYFGMALFIVPGVIISVGWAVIGPAYLHEDTSLFGSFGRSWFLTSGYKWWVWLATIIMGIIWTLIFFVMIGVSAAVASPVVSGLDSPSASAGYSIGNFLIGIMFSVCLYLALALYASFTTALYAELRELKEGPLGEEMSAIFD